MKTLLIIIACLLSGSAMAQSKTLKLDTTGVIISGSLKIDTGKRDLAYSTEGFYTGLYPYPKESTYNFNTNPVTVMKVSPVDKDGNYKVWIDRKRIVWTSDSTFTLKGN